MTSVTPRFNKWELSIILDALNKLSRYDNTPKVRMRIEEVTVKIEHNLKKTIEG